MEENLTSRFSLRFKSLKTLQLIDQATNISGITKNSVINYALEIGLPILIERLSKNSAIENDGASPLDTSIGSAELNSKFKTDLKLQKLENELNFLQNIDLESVKLLQNLLVNINTIERLTSSTYQMLKVSIESSPSFASIPKEIYDKFDNNLPPKFSKEKADSIAQLESRVDTIKRLKGGSK